MLYGLSTYFFRLEVSIGYANMNCHQGYNLNVQSIKVVNVNTTDECIIECIDTVNCTSLNVESVTGETFVNCSILSTDRHREVKNFESKSESEHCSIMVDKLNHFSYYSAK